MKDDETQNLYFPTEAQEEAISRAGLVAAWENMQPLLNEELQFPLKVLACVRAFKAANTATHAARMSLKAAHPGVSDVVGFDDLLELVCSAFMGLDLHEPDEIHPRSIAGERVSALLQAAKALQAMNVLCSAFEHDSEIEGSYAAGDVAMFAEAFILGESEVA